MEKTVYAIGFFDGVHLGHRALLEACRRMAAQTGCRAGVITFRDHPDALVFGEAPKLITTPDARDQLMRKLGMDSVTLLPFDRAMMTLPWQEFYRRLRRDHNACGLVVGADFRFGNRGEGTAESLRTVCQADGIPCTVVPQLLLDGTVISSTHIRSLLRSGDVEQANRFLGDPYTLSGRVIHGRGLGRTLGIPTANLPFPEALEVPAFGVYACVAQVGNKRYPAVTNIGTRPTVSGSGITVEPWILGEVGDIYGQPLTLEFYKFLRPEQKFDSLEQLQQEIRRNAEQTRSLFEEGCL